MVHQRDSPHIRLCFVGDGLLGGKIEMSCFDDGYHGNLNMRKKCHFFFKCLINFNCALQSTDMKQNFHAPS